MMRMLRSTRERRRRSISARPPGVTRQDTASVIRPSTAASGTPHSSRRNSSALPACAGPGAPGAPSAPAPDIAPGSGASPTAPPRIPLPAPPRGPTPGVASAVALGLAPGASPELPPRAPLRAPPGAPPPPPGGHRARPGWGRAGGGGSAAARGRGRRAACARPGGPQGSPGFREAPSTLDRPPHAARSSS